MVNYNSHICFSCSYRIYMCSLYILLICIHNNSIACMFLNVFIQIIDLLLFHVDTCELIHSFKLLKLSFLVWMYLCLLNHFSFWWKYLQCFIILQNLQWRLYFSYLKKTRDLKLKYSMKMRLTTRNTISFSLSGKQFGNMYQEPLKHCVYKYIHEPDF